MHTPNDYRVSHKPAELSLFNHQILLAQSEILEIRFRATPPLKIDSFRCSNELN